MPPAPDSFDPVLLSQLRLGIVSVLLGRGATSFTDLRALLGATQGNLGIHLRKLEEAGYVEVVKEFVDRKPRTTCALTARGRSAFLRHAETLARIARNGSGG